MQHRSFALLVPLIVGCGQLREGPTPSTLDATEEGTAADTVVVSPSDRPSAQPPPGAADCGVTPSPCNARPIADDRPDADDRLDADDRPTPTDRPDADDRPDVDDRPPVGDEPPSTPGCAAGLSLCEGACVSLANSREHCGACGRPCGAEEVCTSGVCACPPGFTRCGATCVDTRVSAAHCGACGNACSVHHGAPACADGRCAIACEAGWADCDGMAATGCEADLAASPTSCGACGVRCGAGEVCLAGACACAPGLTRCGAACVDPRTSVEHCGACGQRCNATNGTPSCVAGSCRIACAAGYGDCDRDARNGCEVSTSGNADHCGACGQACIAPMGGTRACSGGSCRTDCAPGFIRCNNTCVDARSSCSVGTGACRRTGSIVCSGSAGVCGATAGSPGTEACNGVDDNCDGVTDNVSGSCTGNVTGCPGSLSCSASGRVCTSNQRCPLGWTQSGSNCQMPPRSATIYSGDWKRHPDRTGVAAYILPSYTSASGSASVTFRIRLGQDPAWCGVDGTVTAMIVCGDRPVWFPTARDFANGATVDITCAAGEQVGVIKLVCSCDTSPFAGACVRRIAVENVTNGAQPPTCQSSYGQRATLQ